jgi:hypothetical protein
LQPGGHRFEPGILHQTASSFPLPAFSWRGTEANGIERKLAARAALKMAGSRKLAAGSFEALLQLNILQTVVFPTTHLSIVTRMSNSGLQCAEKD